jgi:hypothetical protein
MDGRGGASLDVDIAQLLGDLDPPFGSSEGTARLSRRQSMPAIGGVQKAKRNAKTKLKAASSDDFQQGTPCAPNE